MADAMDTEAENPVSSSGGEGAKEADGAFADMELGYEQQLESTVKNAIARLSEAPTNWCATTLHARDAPPH